MVAYKYGEFADMQIADVKQLIRKKIFFLLLVAEEPGKFPGIDLEKAHNSLMWKISGLNELLGYPTEVVTTMSLLEEALNNLKTNFDFAKYRKLILDAGAEVSKIACNDNVQSADIALKQE
jgi:hypothetical protein